MGGSIGGGSMMSFAGGSMSYDSYQNGSTTLSECLSLGQEFWSRDIQNAEKLMADRIKDMPEIMVTGDGVSLGGGSKDGSLIGGSIGPGGTGIGGGMGGRDNRDSNSGGMGPVAVAMNRTPAFHQLSLHFDDARTPMPSDSEDGLVESPSPSPDWELPSGMAPAGCDSAYETGGRPRSITGFQVRPSPALPLATAGSAASASPRAAQASESPPAPALAGSDGDGDGGSGGGGGGDGSGDDDDESTVIVADGAAAAVWATATAIPLTTSGGRSGGNRLRANSDANSIVAWLSGHLEAEPTLPTWNMVREMVVVQWPDCEFETTDVKGRCKDLLRATAYARAASGSAAAAAAEALNARRVPSLGLGDATPMNELGVETMAGAGDLASLGPSLDPGDATPTPDRWRGRWQSSHDGTP